MKICVYGAGAIGGYLAGSMAKAGIDVSVVARGAHLAAIRRDGLTVETNEGVFTAQVRASDDPADLGPQDGVIVTVKAPSLPSVAGNISPLLGPDTPVAFLTNGLPWWYFMGHGGPLDGTRLPEMDPGDVLWNTIGSRTIGGIFWPASAVPKPGYVKLVAGAGRGCTIGTPDGADSPALQLLAEAYRVAGLPLTLAPEIRDAIWEKLAFNLSAGPMCVLTMSPVRVTHEDEVLVETSRKVMAEATALIAALGRKVTIDPEKVVAGNRVLGHRPSILQDLEAGRPMEVDALYGMTLKMAKLVGVEMPTLSLLAALIKVRARSAGLYGG